MFAPRAENARSPGESRRFLLCNALVPSKPNRVRASRALSSRPCLAPSRSAALLQHNVGPCSTLDARVLSQFPTIILKAPKPNLPLSTKEFITIGDHILHRRRDLGLLQKEIAGIFDVGRGVIISWETRRCTPRVRLMPAIINFLGNAPYKVPRSFGEWLAQCRMVQGLTRKELAVALGFDDETVGNWETGRTRVRKTARKIINNYFGSLPSCGA
jgi:transcriptional regulator with XRE-family HTH domain